MNTLKSAFLKLKNGLKIKGGGSNAVLSNMNAVLYNKFVLYFILIVSMGNLFFLISAKEYMFASIFILVGFITSFFSKNMMVILCIAMVVTNILKYGSKASVEGMESAADENTDALMATGKSSKTETADMTSKSSQKKDDKEPEGKLNDKQEKILEQYRELLGLQEKITQSMKNINDPLSKAEGLVSSMKENLQNIN